MGFSFKKYLEEQAASLHTFNTTDTSFQTKEIPSSKNTKFWIYPDGKIVNLSGNWHYEHILNNLTKLKKYGIKESELPETPTEQAVRLYALSKGFTRCNYQANGGKLVIETPANNYGRTIKGAIFDFVFDNLQRVDQLYISVLNNEGRTVKRGDFNWINSTNDQKMEQVQSILEKVVFVNASDSQLVTESSLSRVYQHNVEHDCGAISAFRKTFSRKENDQRNKSLLAKLMSAGYSVTKLIGKYPEGGEVVSETSFFVADIKNSGNLFADLADFGEQFEQDSILFIPKGSVEGKDKAFLYGTNNAPSNWLGYHNSNPFDVGKLGAENPIYTSYIHGRPFMFESAGSEYERPQTGFGTWMLNLHAKKDWNKF